MVVSRVWKDFVGIYFWWHMLDPNNVFLAVILKVVGEDVYVVSPMGFALVCFYLGCRRVFIVKGYGSECWVGGSFDSSIVVDGFKVIPEARPMQPEILCQNESKLRPPSYLWRDFLFSKSWSA